MPEPYFITAQRLAPRFLPAIMQAAATGRRMPALWGMSATMPPYLCMVTKAVSAQNARDAFSRELQKGMVARRR